MQTVVFKKADTGSIGGDSFIIELILRGMKNTEKKPFIFSVKSFMMMNKVFAKKKYIYAVKEQQNTDRCFKLSTS